VRTKDTFQGECETVVFGGASMQGWRRTMEDAHLAQLQIGPHRSDIFGVFDGHGGPEVARFCERHMGDQIQATSGFQEGDMGGAMVSVFHRMDEMLNDPERWKEIESLRDRPGEPEGEGEGGEPNPIDLLRKWFDARREGEGEGEGEGSAGTPVAEQELQAGCTAVVAMLHRGSVYVANAGDSRAVISKAGVAEALSEDHKPTQDTERQRIVKAGGFVSEIGGVARVNANLNLSRAIGDLRYKSNRALPPKDQIITAEPDITVTELLPEHEFMVLACDGVWDVMTNQQVVTFVRERLGTADKPGLSAEETCCELLDACLAKDPKESRGIGCDNMTAVVVQFRKGALAGVGSAGN